MASGVACAALAVVLVLAPPGVGGPEPAGSPRERVELDPPVAAGFSFRHAAAAVTSLFGLREYWFARRVLAIETVPAGARVHLAYLRQQTSRAAGRGRAPLDVGYPNRDSVHHMDVLKISARRDGFLSREVAFAVNELPERVRIELEPLPNALVGLSRAHLAGRTTLFLRFQTEPQFRTSRGATSHELNLWLEKTADGLERSPAPRAAGWVRSLDISQVGDDLLLRVQASQTGLQARTRSQHDPARDLAILRLDLMPDEAQMPDARELRASFEALDLPAQDRCDARFEDTLRERLGTGIRDRFPPDSLERLVRNEAMLHLGRLRGGAVETLGARSYALDDPLQLELALQSGERIPGFWALLRAWAASDRDPQTVLRSLIAPESDEAAFAAAYRAAEAALQPCKGPKNLKK